MKLTIILLTSLFIIGSILLVIGLYLKRRKSTWSRVKGEIVEPRPEWETSDTKPIVKYYVEEMEYTIESKRKKQHSLQEGEKVTVYYHPNNPKQMMTNTFFQNEKFYFIIGCLLIVAAIMMLFTE